MKRRSSFRTVLWVECLEDRTAPATLTVTSLLDTVETNKLVTLREAIMAAETDSTVDGVTGNGADTINFAPGLFAGGPPTIELSTIGDSQSGPSAFAINSPLSISGGSVGVRLVRSDSVAELRHFVIGLYGNLTLDNMDLSGGIVINAEGGAISNRGELTLLRSKVHDNQVAAPALFFSIGGGIYNSGTLEIRDSFISANKATAGTNAAFGGGIANSGTMTIINTPVTGNSIVGEGAGGGIHNDGFGSATITDCLVSGNQIGASGKQGHGGGIMNRGALSLTDSWIQNNGINSSIYSSGGGIATAEGGILNLANVWVAGNWIAGTYGAGGGLSSLGGTSQLTNSHIDGNWVVGDLARGGGVNLETGEGGGASLSLVNTTVSENYTDGSATSAGGIFARRSTLSMTGGAIQHNRAIWGNLHSDGGGLYLLESSATLTRASVSDNVGSDAGGVMVEYKSQLTAIDSIFRNNKASDGGGAVAVRASATAVFSRTTFEQNDADNSGGAIHNLGTVQITDSTLRQNVSGFGGSAIYSQGQLTMTGCTINGNVFDQPTDCGTVWLSGSASKAALTNCTVSGNYGVDLWASGGAFLSLKFCTVAGYTSVLTGAKVQLLATILAAPEGGTVLSLYKDGSSTIESLGHNLSDDDSFLGSSIDVYGIDPLLGPLADNGGPTQSHALGLSSIAINGANDWLGHVLPAYKAPATDQRGAVRDGFADIGAFESVPEIWIDDVSINEGNTGIGSAVVTVRLTRPTASPLPVSLDFATDDVFASAGADYMTVAGTLSFGANQSSRFIVVPITGDTLVEGNETLAIRLGGPTVGMLRDDRGLVTIRDDDKIAGAGNYVLSLDETGQRRILTRNGATILDQPAALDGVGGKLEITGAKASADSLTVDSTFGDPAPTGGVFFNGLNSGGKDRLILAGRPYSAVDFDYTGPRSGAIRPTGLVGPAPAISFTEVEQVSSTIAIDDVKLLLPVSNDTAYLRQPAAGTITLQGLTIPTTTLVKPKNLTFDGRRGVDQLIVNGSSLTLAEDLFLKSDIVRVQSSVQVRSLYSDGGSFTLAAGMSLSAGVISLMHSTINVEGKLDAQSAYAVTGDVLVKGTGNVVFHVNTASPPAWPMMNVNGNLKFLDASTITIDTGTSTAVAGPGPYPLASATGTLTLSPRFRLVKLGTKAAAVASVFADLAATPDYLKVRLT